MLFKYVLFILFLTVFIPSVSPAADPPVASAVRVSSPPRIDGTLDDEVWKQAEPVTGFTQLDPEEGKPATQRTEIRIVYDDDAVYFACMFYDNDPGAIVSRLTRRDDRAEADNASIYIDAYHDKQTGYEFSFNVSGVKIDALQYDDGNRSDDSWDPVWELETRITSQGWCAEIKIPFRVLRFKKMDAEGAENVWGVNFVRHVSRNQEDDLWAFIPKKESGFISRFGTLTGLTNLPNPSRVELLPFAVAKQRYAPSNGPLRSVDKFNVNGGLDLKYGVSSSFLLDATVNPDFGQVEADPAVLNLSSFETFYPEKRPFFIEGTQIIHFTTFGGDFGPGMFYSRRIGRAISPFEASVPPGGYIESIPQNTTILGAAKLTGKTNGGLSVGVLEAATKEERAVVVDAAGVHTEQVVEPFANYNVFRLKQDIWDNSNIGTIVTLTAKDSRSPAITNGYDWNINIDHNTYNLTGFFAHSHSTRGGGRIDGTAGKLGFSRVAAEHWLWSGGADFTSKQYNINDAGFFFSPNDVGYSTGATYKEDRPGDLLRNYSAGARWHQRWDFDGNNLFREISSSWYSRFMNYWSLGAGVDYEFGAQDNYETHGNGPYGKPHATNVNANLNTDGRKMLVFSIGESYSWDAIAKRVLSSDVGIELKAVSWMTWQLQGSYQTVRNQLAWGYTDPVNGNIFGDRNTDQYDFVLRNTTTFSRDLTLQVYGQLFLAKGGYGNSRVQVGQADFAPLPSSVSPIPDFNGQSFNTNVVLRWEYLPGSTAYLVWSHSRNGGLGSYATSFGTDLDNTFSVAPSNVFLLKLNYWLSL